jgi:hypothetical protein
MRELVERAYFAVCLTLGRLLRASRYSKTSIVRNDGELEVHKQRRVYAPLLIWMGGLLTTILDTGVKVFPQRAWQERERELYLALYDTSITIDAGGTLFLPCFPGVTLAELLGNTELEASARIKAVESSVVALARLHERGLTHADAMAENVMVDLGSELARWFDFETVHDPTRSSAWCRADDLRALLATCMLRTRRDQIATTLGRIMDTYADKEVTALLVTSFASPWRRPLSFHLGQAPTSFELFREIHRLLAQKSRRLD